MVHPSMSSHWKNFTAEHAIDFDERTEADKCFCCSGTSSAPAWWSINLGNTYPIKAIIFIGRSGKLYSAIHIVDEHPMTPNEES